MPSGRVIAGSTRAGARPRRGSKYGAVRVEWRGETYDSRAEARAAVELETMRLAGLICSWMRGQDWPLLDVPAGSRDQVRYRPDFEVTRLDGSAVAIDIKGVQTAVFRLKAKLWRVRYPDWPLLVIPAGEPLAERVLAEAVASGAAGRGAAGRGATGRGVVSARPWRTR